MAFEGGHKGFDKVIWKVAEHKQGDTPSITFKYRSLDGEEGNLFTHFNLKFFLLLYS